MKHILSNERLRDICTGKVTFRKCPFCDSNGLEYWDGAGGLSPSPSPHGINPEWLTSGECQECGGLALVENTELGA